MRSNWPLKLMRVVFDIQSVCKCVRPPGNAVPLQVLERSGRDLVLSCPDVIENLMGLVWSKDLKTLRYTTGANPLFSVLLDPA